MKRVFSKLFQIFYQRGWKMGSTRFGHRSILLALLVFFVSSEASSLKISCKKCEEERNRAVNTINNTVEAVKEGVENIGDTLTQARDDAYAEAKRVEERAKEAEEWAREQAQAAERAAKKKLAEAEKRLRENLEAIAEFPVTVATKIGNTIKNVIVRAGESLTDAIERSEKGLEHLGTESFRQYQVLERNISKAKAINVQLNVSINDLKVQKTNMTILNNPQAYFSQSQNKLDLKKISIAKVSNAVATWDDFAEGDKFKQAVNTVTEIHKTGITTIIATTDLLTAPVTQWLDDKIVDPAGEYLDRKYQDFNHWVTDAYHDSLTEMDRWDDYWGKVGEDVKDLTWSKAGEELGRWGTWVEDRLGTNKCDEDGTIQKNRNKILCLDENIGTLMVSIDTQKGITLELWQMLKKDINIKINDVQNFMSGEYGETSISVFQLQSSFNQMATIKAEEENLICNTDWTSSATAPRAISVGIQTQFTRINLDNYASPINPEVFTEQKNLTIEYLSCQQIPTKGTATDHSGQLYRFTSDIQFTSTTPMAAQQSQTISVNSSESQHGNFRLTDCQASCSGTDCTNSCSGPKDTTDECTDESCINGKDLWDGLKEIYDRNDSPHAPSAATVAEIRSRRDTEATLAKSLATATQLAQECGGYFEVVQIANRGFMDIEPSELKSSQMVRCSGGESNALANILSTTQQRFTAISSSAFNLSDSLLSTVLSRLGKSSITDSDCDEVPGLRSKLNEMGGNPRGATDAIINEHITPSRSNTADRNNLIAIACWSKALNQKKDSRNTETLKEVISSAKRMGNELGNDNASYQLLKEKARALDARQRLVGYTKPDLPQKAAALDQADLALDLAEEALAENDQVTAGRAIDYARTALDFVTDIGPVGSFKGAISIITGKNPVTGENLEPLDYVFAAIDVVDVFGGTRAVTRAAKYLYKISSKGKKTKAIADKMLDAIKTTDRVASKGRFPCGISLSLTDCDVPGNIPVGEITDEMLDKSRRLGVTKPDDIKAYSKFHAGVEASNIPVDAAKGFRFKPGSNDKIAVMGRSMGGDPQYPNGVTDLHKSLIEKGIDPNKVEIFTNTTKDVSTGNPVISEKAWAEWMETRKQYSNNVPDDVVKTLDIYKENEAWIRKLKDQGYTVIDMGNPYDRPASVFYDLEKTIFWGQ